jgi:hypothetical protein
MRYLLYLLPWVRRLFLIRSITSTEWDEMTGRLVQPLLRCALEMRRQIARDGYCFILYVIPHRNIVRVVAGAQNTREPHRLRSSSTRQFCSVS